MDTFSIKSLQQFFWYTDSVMCNECELLGVLAWWITPRGKYKQSPGTRTRSRIGSPSSFWERFSKFIKESLSLFNERLEKNLLQVFTLFGNTGEWFSTCNSYHKFASTLEFLIPCNLWKYMRKVWEKEQNMSINENISPILRWNVATLCNNLSRSDQYCYQLVLEIWSYQNGFN